MSNPLVLTNSLVKPNLFPPTAELSRTASVYPRQNLLQVCEELLPSELGALIGLLLIRPEARLLHAQVASAFADYWTPFSRLQIANAKRVKPDPKFASEQQDWPLHRKWMKELYEARSAAAHGDPSSDFSQNWSAPQHLVIAAFVFPLTVKLRLAEEGHYSLSDRELGACEAIDQLLDSSWGSGWRRPPQWSNILSLAEGHRELHTVIMRAVENHKEQRS